MNDNGNALVIEQGELVIAILVVLLVILIFVAWNNRPR